MREHEKLAAHAALLEERNTNLEKDFGDLRHKLEFTQADIFVLKHRFNESRIDSKSQFPVNRESVIHF